MDMHGWAAYSIDFVLVVITELERPSKVAAN